jgi:hypothetical protein
MAFLYAGCTQMMDNVAEVMFGKAISSAMFDSLASVMAKFSQCIQLKNHCRFLSGAVVLEIAIFLVMVGTRIYDCNNLSL